MKTGMLMQGRVKPPFYLFSFPGDRLGYGG